ERAGIDGDDQQHDEREQHGASTHDRPPGDWARCMKTRNAADVAREEPVGHRRHYSRPRRGRQAASLRVARTLPAKVRVIALAPDGGPEAIVPALVNRVVAGLAEDDAIVHRVQSAQLDVLEVMGPRPFAEPVLSSSDIPDVGDMRPTGGASELL